MARTINIGGNLMAFDRPKVMGILNITPDSFYAESRKQEEDVILNRATEILQEGADIIDFGAYSTRPGAISVTMEDEMSRLRKGLELVTQEYPHAVISVDTFRADVAKMCVEEYGVAIINDISAGGFDERMFQTIANLHVPYVITHSNGKKGNLHTPTEYDNIMHDMVVFFAERVNMLHGMGVCDVILDPGFGFSKSLDQNYTVMANLHYLKEFNLPLMVGVSRKSMIYNLLATNPEGALNGTMVLNTLALMNDDVNILRVHDVKQCVEVVKIVEKVKQSVLNKDNYVRFWNK